jgi:hypothetical protein
MRYLRRRRHQLEAGRRSQPAGTAGPPPKGSLAADFLDYITGTTADDVLRTSDYTPCVDRGMNLPKTMCSLTSP